MDWQHPFVDVFKQFGVYELAQTQSKGQVSVVQDNQIGRKIIRLQGAISANNAVTVPDPVQGIRSLGLSGRYLYLQFIPSSGRYFTAHFDITVKDREIPVKLTLSNMYENHKVQGNVLQIPYPKNAPSKWTILILDIEYFLSNFGLLPHSLYKTFKGIHQVRSFQLCSSMNVRGIYTSNNLYDWETMPKSMLFKLPRGGKYSDEYQIAYWPTLDVQPQVQKQPLKEVASTIIENLHQIEENRQKFKNDSQKSFHRVPQQNTAPQHEELVKKRPGDQNLQAKSIEASDHPLQPYPIQTLEKIIGFTVRTCPDIKWGRQNDTQRWLTYAAGNLLVQINVASGEQKFFFGHSNPITCLDVSRDGDWLVSGQSGKHSVVRIWRHTGECLSAFATTYIDLVNVSFSSDRKLLVTAGSDEHKREILMVWGLDKVEATRRPLFLAKQTCVVNVLSVKFSPVDNNRLVSCGHENIRFWRIKELHLPGASLVLNHHARNTTFAVFDFEYNFESSTVAHIYFGSKSGYLFQVSYEQQRLLQVFKVHVEAITAVCVTSVFCITGSLDQFLRVWPLDFNEFHIEAKHEGVIASLDMSIDGLQVACGTSTGGLGILDISSHHYKTVIRSHTGIVRQIQMHNLSKLLITLSEDCTIRLWDLEICNQVYEFSFSNEDRCNVISSCPNGMFFAAGFKSGIHRIFDIENTSIIFEGKYHDAEICSIEYSPDGRQLAVGDCKQVYKVYDVVRDYQPIKTIQSSVFSVSNTAYSKDSAILALIEGGTNIELWDTYTLQLLLKITTKHRLRQLLWASNNVELLSASLDGRIIVHGIERQNELITAYFLREQTFMHKQRVNDFVISPNMKYLFSVGVEQFVKVWDYEFQIKGAGSCQVFIGHQSEVNAIEVCDGGQTIVSAGGEEGILIWKFHGYTGKNERYLKMEQVVSKEVQPPPPQQEDEELLDDYDVPQPEQAVEDPNKLVDVFPLTRPIVAQEENETQILQKEGTVPFKQDEFKPYRLNQEMPVRYDYERRILTRSASRRKFGKLVKYVQNEWRKKNNLPYRQLIIEKGVNKADRSLEIESHNMVGFNNESHDNIVWCRSQGWYAYTSTCFLIVEQLRQDRQQQIIPFPVTLSVLALDKNEKHLLIGTASKVKDSAPIYIYSTESLKQTGVLSFHTNGVHQIQLTEDNKYLLSIGNGKECTVVVWDYPGQKLLASSYSLDRINDARISKYAFSKERVFEFATVGRDQVYFWAFTKEQKLEYYDVFLPKGSQDKLEEITSFDYICYAQQAPRKDQSMSFQQQSFSQSQDKQSSTVKTEEINLSLESRQQASFQNINQQSSSLEASLPQPSSVVQLLILGLQSGDIQIMKYGEFKIVMKRILTNSEIALVRVYQAVNKIIILTTDACFYIMDLQNVISLNGFLESGFPFQKVNLPSMVCAFAIEPLFSIGIFGLQNGSICLINLTSRSYFPLTYSNGDYVYDVTNPTTEKNLMPFTSTCIKNSQLVEDQFVVNIHQGGVVKVWDLVTAEQLTEYNWDREVTSMIYDAQSKLMIFYQEFGQIKQVAIDRLDHVDQFYIQSKLGPDTIVSSFFGMFDQIPTRFALDQSGQLFYHEQLFKNSEFIIRLSKILELPNAGAIVEHSEKRVMFVVEQLSGTVTTLQVDYNAAREIAFGFTVFDQINFLDNPHGNLDTQESKKDTKILYSQADVQTRVCSAKGLDSVYFAILDSLMYLYGRNYQKKQTILLISLRELPLNLAMSDACKVYIVTQNGNLEIVSPNNPNNNQRFELQIEDTQQILISRRKQILFLANRSNMIFWKY